MGIASERRKERRHIVVDMDAYLDGVLCPIIDISRTAVRLLTSSVDEPQDHPRELVLRVQGRARRSCREYRVSVWFIRGSCVDVVYGYQPPTKRWEATLRAHDTFQQTRLLEL